MMVNEELFGLTTSLNVVVCKDAEDATAKGYVYAEKKITPVKIEKVVVVQRGTEMGNTTVDLVLTDSVGNKYVTMLTYNLLKSIPCGSAGGD